MTISNGDLASGMEDLISQLQAATISDVDFITQLTTLFDNWMGVNVSNAALALKMQSLVTAWRVRETQLRAWLAGTATGGPGSDGLYELDDDVGNVYFVPCPAKMVSVTQKGDPAKIDAAFSYAGPFGAAEILPGLAVVQAGTFVVANSRAKCLTNATASSVFTIMKNGSAWGTVTFTPGSNNGTIVIAAPTVAIGDVLHIVAPSAHDATLSDVFITLAGA